MKTKFEMRLIAEENHLRRKAAEIERFSRRESEARERAELTGEWSEVNRLRGAIKALDR